MERKWVKTHVTNGLKTWTEVVEESTDQGGDPCMDDGIDDVMENLETMGFTREEVVSAFKDPKFYKRVWAAVRNSMVDMFAEEVTKKLMKED